MLKFAAVVCVMLSGGFAEAVKWDFDDGTPQGWTPKEGLVWGGAYEFNHFPGVVDEGVWRIRVDHSVTKSLYASRVGVKLISSHIGYDSELFDQVRIRCRTIHDRPTEGNFNIAWENASGVTDIFEAYVGQRTVYTTEWQELVLSLADQARWEGLLKNIQLSFALTHDTATDRVAAFEIDFIELTGVGELIQGELPPPDVAHYFRSTGVGLFAPPVFYPIAPGIGEAPYKGNGGRYLGETGGNVLTDLDGDGDLDLFGLWETVTEAGGNRKSEAGWLMAVNDGRGVLERGPIIEEETTNLTGAILDVLGADLTGDGRDEIALSRSNREPGTRVLSIGPELQVEVLMQTDMSVHSVADWDGDGRVELFTGGGMVEGSLDDIEAGTATFSSRLAVWEVAQGVWTSEMVAASQDYVPLHIGDFTGDGIIDMFWTPLAGNVLGAQRWFVGPLGKEQSGEVFEFDAERLYPLEIGDFDGDGQVDFLTEFTSDPLEGSKGIVLQRKNAGDRLEATVLYDDRLLRRSSVLVRDLNADGVDDWVFIGGDRVSGFGVFVEWGGLVNPTQEGEWHPFEGDGRYVLAGDMDRDGDLDLVVLDPIAGGMHLFKSSLGEQMTAVMTPATAQPTQHRLGDSYPNPFNPQVVLPLDLATDAAAVSLTVYDVLGRRVRQMWNGPLRAGNHRFVWDGRDEMGKGVAAGVYVYQAAVDGRVEAKKTTKLP